MRLLIAAVFACALLVIGEAGARAETQSTLDVTAQHVRFYSERYEVTADGDVHIRLSDGTTLRGQTFAMDLRLNRYVIAGDVHLDTTNGVHEVGAGFAGYPDLGRNYFLPADGGVPDRVTFFGNDWTHPHLGREQPGDAFYLPGLDDHRPYIMAHGVNIIPRTNLIFRNALVRAVGVEYVPTPRYVITFSPNSHFYENAYSGARFNIAEPFYGSAHSLSELDVRNDPINGTYLALQQHFVYDKGYVVLSIDPLTQESRQYNLIAYDKPNPILEIRTFDQVTESQHEIISGGPISGSSYESLQINKGLPHSGLSLSANQYDYDLLGLSSTDVAYDEVSFPIQLEHPFDVSLNWTGFEERLGKHGILYNLRYRLRSGFTYAHDTFGVAPEYAGYLTQPEDLTSHFVGASLYTPAIPLGDQFTFTAHGDKQRTWYSIPHHVDNTDIGASIARPFLNNKLNTYVAQDYTSIGDYWGDQQNVQYPLPVPGTTYPDVGFGTFPVADFEGFATYRTTQFGLTYSPTAYFGVNIQMAVQRNTPVAVPEQYGNAPYQLTGTFHFRLAPNLAVDLTRGYYFNFGTARWSPQTLIQFAP